MDQQTIQAIERSVRWRLPFAAWRMPDAEAVHFCAAPSLMAVPAEAATDGFFACPFARPFAEACRIPFEIGAAEVLNMDMPSQQLPQLSSESTDKDEYLSRLAGLISNLKARGNAKTVISTVKTEGMPSGDTARHVAAMAKHLFDNGKGLFCNCWHHPRLGLWMGATPELLLNIRGRQLKSVALAGTTAIGRDWDEKNKAEQQFVVDYIADVLSTNNIMPETSPTCEAVFGRLKHLRTDFAASLPDGTDVEAIIDVLNPTPALCGYPKKQALNDIASIESHQRLCYGGLVGVAHGDEFDAYVNIRCAQIGASQCKYFAGGGITADSRPEAEWAEAQAKRQQLINFFNQEIL